MRKPESGVAIIELALFLPLLCLIFAGVVDYSVAIQQTIRVQQSANAGAAYGTIPGNESNLSGMQTAALAEGVNISGMTATASNYYTCTPGGAAVNSTTNCSSATYQDPGTPIKYILVKTSATLSASFAYPGMPKNLVVSGTSTMRAPWSK